MQRWSGELSGLLAGKQIATTARRAAIITQVPRAFSNMVTAWCAAGDPDDAHHVNLALAASAELIISRDRDLLDLMDPSRKESVEFRRRFPLLRIQDPVQFLRQFDEADC